MDEWTILHQQLEEIQRQRLSMAIGMGIITFLVLYLKDYIEHKILLFTLNNKRKKNLKNITQDHIYKEHLNRVKNLKKVA